MTRLIEATLRVYDAQPNLRDESVAAAIRCELSGGETTRPPVQALAINFRGVGESLESEKLYRSALEALDVICREHRCDGDPRAFLEFLRILAS